MLLSTFGQDVPLMSTDSTKLIKSMIISAPYHFVMIIKSLLVRVMDKSKYMMLTKKRELITFRDIMEE